MSVFDVFKRGNRHNPDVVEQRRATCNICPERAGPVCGVCGCIVKLKTQIDNETCPRGRWEE